MASSLDETVAKIEANRAALAEIRERELAELEAQTVARVAVLDEATRQAEAQIAALQEQQRRDEALRRVRSGTTSRPFSHLGPELADARRAWNRLAPHEREQAKRMNREAWRAKSERADAEERRQRGID